VSIRISGVPIRIPAALRIAALGTSGVLFVVWDESSSDQGTGGVDGDVGQVKELAGEANISKSAIAGRLRRLMERADGTAHLV